MVWFQVINLIHLTYRVFLSKILQTVYLIYTQQGEKPSSIYVRWPVRLPENLRGYFSSFCFVLDFVAFFLKTFGKVFNGWKATCMFICDTFLHTICLRMKITFFIGFQRQFYNSLVWYFILSVTFSITYRFFTDLPHFGDIMIMESGNSRWRNQRGNHS